MNDTAPSNAALALQQVDIIAITVSIWSGRKKLTSGDLKVDDAMLPPEEVASLGHKKVMDPEALAPFHQLKKQMERIAEKVGFRFLGGFAIPKSKTACVATGIKKLIAEFETKRAAFIAGYDNAVENWVAKHPEFEAPLRRAIEPANVIAGKIHARIAVYQVSPSEQDDGSLVEEAGQMTDLLFGEVAAAANDMWERVMANKLGSTQINRRNAAPLRALRDKLDSMSFLDGGIAVVVEKIDDVLNRFPPEGPITGALYHEVMSLLQILSDRGKIKRFAAGLAAEGGGDWFQPAPMPTVQPEADTVTTASGGDEPQGDFFDDLFGDIEFGAGSETEPLAPMEAAPASSVNDNPPAADGAITAPITAEQQPTASVLKPQPASASSRRPTARKAAVIKTKAGRGLDGDEDDKQGSAPHAAPFIVINSQSAQKPPAFDAFF